MGIEENKIKESIKSHGFLLEEEIKGKLKSFGWICENSPHYKDPDEGKSREMDIFAMKRNFLLNMENREVSLRLDLIIQCKDYKDPFLFFLTEESYKDKLLWKDRLGFFTAEMGKVAIKDYKDQKISYLIDTEEFLDLKKNHHFFLDDKRATNFTQIIVKDNCKLKDKEEGIKLYDSIIIPLLKATIFREEKSIEILRGIINNPNRLHDFYFNIPILVLRNKFWVAYVESGEIKLEERDYTQYITDYNSETLEGVFQIDIVSKEYFQKYMEEKISKTMELIGESISSQYSSLQELQEHRNWKFRGKKS